MCRRVATFAAAFGGLAGCWAAPRDVQRSFDQALRFGTDPRRGVVLFLHGCDGLGGSTLIGFETAWVRYLIDRGFLVVAPNSFADPRPVQACAPPFPKKERIYDIRSAQTAFAIERLRAAYPGKKLLVWGHSEGAGVANRITLPVDGIITTGYQCGYRDTGKMLLDSLAPLLVIVGAEDPMANAATRTEGDSPESVCRRIITSSRWQFVLVPGMGHGAPIDEPAVRSAVARFLTGAAPGDGAADAPSAEPPDPTFPHQPSSEIDGVFQNPDVAAAAPQVRLVFTLKDGQYVLARDERTEERYGYIVDPRAVPKRVDFTDVLGKTTKAIYELTTDGFRFAFFRADDRQTIERPHTFTDSALTVVTMRRVR